MSEADKKLKDDLHSCIVQVLTDFTRTSGLKPKSVAKPLDTRPPWERAKSVLEEMRRDSLNVTSSVRLTSVFRDVLSLSIRF